MSTAINTRRICMAPGCPEPSTVKFMDNKSPSDDGWGYVCHRHAEELAGRQLAPCHSGSPGADR